MTGLFPPDLPIESVSEAGGGENPMIFPKISKMTLPTVFLISRRPGGARRNSGYVGVSTDPELFIFRGFRSHANVFPEKY